MYPLTLSGRAVVLREFRPDDVAEALGVGGDDRVTRWLSYLSRDHAGMAAVIDEAIEIAQRVPRTEFLMAVTLPDGPLVGFGRLTLGGTLAGKLGYSINPNYWRRGYGSDVARTLADFGFDTLGLHRISAAIAPDNVASIRVAEGLGMTYEGRLRHHFRRGSLWRDSVLYSVLEHEWTSRDAHPAA